ncbi:MAG: hypothetical protein HY917_03855 [Candidatus Diapherotrites archaeon]|nr:hypothetical protein [Candidatus Diapherotrites archaeon]
MPEKPRTVSLKRSGKKFLGRKQPLFIEGEHAITFDIPSSEKDRFGYPLRKKLVGRTVPRQLFPGTLRLPAYSVGQCIAQLLYPFHFPKLVASVNPHHVRPEPRKLAPPGPQKEWWNQGFTTHSKKILLTDGSYAGINGYYSFDDRLYYPSYPAHELDVHAEATALAKKFMQESGIQVNTSAMNVGRKPNGKLVFFEVLSIHLPTLEKRVSRMRPGLKKKQLLALVEHLKPFESKYPPNTVPIHQ